MGVDISHAATRAAALAGWPLRTNEEGEADMAIDATAAVAAEAASIEESSSSGQRR